MAALQGTYVILWLRAIGLGGLGRHVARYQGNRLGAQDRLSLLLTLQFGRTIITLQAPCDPWPPGQLGAGRLHYRRVCICVADMVNTADKSQRQVHISLVAIYFRYFWRRRRAARSLTSQGRAEPLCARIESANREVSEGKADL
ncbi:unnamed protein product [Ascophyllum nodosum]